MSDYNVYDAELITTVTELVIASHHIPDTIKSILSLIGKKLGVSRVYIIEYSLDNMYASVTYEWCADGISSEIHIMKNSPKEIIDCLIPYYNEKGICALENTQNVPEFLRPFINEQNIKAILECLLYYENEVEGILGLDDCKNERIWTDFEKNTLWMCAKLITFIIMKERQSAISGYTSDYFSALNDQYTMNYIIDPVNYDVLYLNKAAIEFFGNDCAGKKCYNAFLYKDSPCIKCPARNYVENGNGNAVQNLRDDGVALLSSAFPIKWFGKSEIMVTCMDISEYWNAQEEERIKYRDALMVDAFHNYEADLTDNMIYEPPIYNKMKNNIHKLPINYPVNYDHYVETFVRTFSVDLKNSSTKVIENRDKLIKRFESGERRIEMDFRIQKGKYYGHKTILLAKRKKDGHIIANIIVRDNTDEMRTQEARNEFFIAMSNISPMIASVNLTRNHYEIIDYKNYIMDVLPVSGVFDELLESVLDQIHEDYKQIFINTFSSKALIKAFDEGKQEVSLDYPQYGNDGQLHWIKSRVFRVHDSFDNDYREITITRDITEQKNIELETKIKQEEYQKNLKTANEAAQAANKAKTLFLSAMSHDIRTPLNGIVGMTKIARDHLDDKEKLIHCLDKITESSDYLLSLINEILDINRIESGKVVPKYVPMDIRSAMENYMSILYSYAVNRDLKLISDFDSLDSPYVMADSFHMREIFMNILSNAVKYTPDGGTIHINMKKLPCEKEGNIKIRLSCTDTGIGISQEFLPHIFETFTQEDKYGARTKYNGSGLGMAIVKRYTDMLGGEIFIESEPDKGTCISIEFILETVTKDVFEGVSENGAVDTKILKGMKMLLAEDNEINREIVKEILTDVDIILDCAENGAKAVEMFSKSAYGEYKAILMDIMMPVMNGYEATQAIRKMNRSDAKEIPIVALTANAFASDIKKSVESGINSHISKPIDFNLLLNTLIGFYK